MMAHLRGLVPAEQLIVVYADLGEVVWPGTKEHIQATIGEAPFFVATAAKTLLQKVEERGMFPSPAMRWCTSDLKRDPIAKVIRQVAKARGARVVISCEGLRAQESCERAKKEAFELNKRLSSGGRTVYNWRPLLSWSTEQVFATIAAAGQKPHWAYASGMSRLSCAFCIMASPQDLATAAKLRSSLYARYVALEKHLGVSMLMPKKGQGPRFLEEVTGVKATEGSAL